MKLSETTQFLHSKGYLVEKQKHVLNQAAKSKDDEFYTYMKDKNIFDRLIVRLK